MRFLTQAHKQILQPLKQWQQDFLDCLPSGVRQRVAPIVAPYVLSIDERSAHLVRDVEGRRQELGVLELGSHTGNIPVATTLVNRKAPLILCVPDSWVLRKQTSFPDAAKENLYQVIGFEMDRLTPFSSEQVYYDYQVRTKASDLDDLSVDVAVLPRFRIQPWLEQLADMDVRGDAIRADALWTGVNFLPPELQDKIDIQAVLIKVLPVLLIIFLLAAVMTLPLWQKRQVARTLQTQEQSLKKEANAAVEVRTQVNKEYERLQQLQDAWLSYPPAIDVIKAITDLLPDDTSLQQLELKEDKLILRGASSQASSLLGLLEGSPGFTEAKFMSSVVQQRGKEQFHLSAQVVMPFEGVDYFIGEMTDTPLTPEEGQDTLPSERGPQTAPDILLSPMEPGEQ